MDKRLINLKSKLWLGLRNKYVPQHEILPMWLRIVWRLLHPKLAIIAYANSTIGYDAYKDTWNLGGSVQIPTEVLIALGMLSSGETLTIKRVSEYNYTANIEVSNVEDDLPKRPYREYKV